MVSPTVPWAARRTSTAAAGALPARARVIAAQPRRLQREWQRELERAHRQRFAVVDATQRWQAQRRGGQPERLRAKPAADAVVTGLAPCPCAAADVATREQEPHRRDGRGWRRAALPRGSSAGRLSRGRGPQRLQLRVGRRSHRRRPTRLTLATTGAGAAMCGALRAPEWSSLRGPSAMATMRAGGCAGPHHSSPATPSSRSASAASAADPRRVAGPAGATPRGTARVAHDVVRHLRRHGGARPRWVVEQQGNDGAGALSHLLEVPCARDWLVESTPLHWRKS